MEMAIVIIIMGVCGILFFSCLEKSMKSERKFAKILYILVGTVLSIVVIECVHRLMMDRESGISTFFVGVSHFLFRSCQIGLGVVGILMCIGILLIPKKT